MKRSILIAVVAVLLLAVPALADMMDLQAVGDPELGNSWSQKFGIRAGDWDTFNQMTFEITNTNYAFESPALSAFFKLTGDSNGPDIKDQTSTAWSLASETGTKAVASGTAIGGKYNWLQFTAKFDGDPPDNHYKLGLKITVVDTTDGSGWYTVRQFWQDSTGVYGYTISEEGKVVPTVIPAPAALLLGMLGLGLVGWVKRRIA